MKRRVAIFLSFAGLAVGIAATPVFAYSGIFDHSPFESSPPSLTDVARMIDHIESNIHNQGTVVVKQPDIWSQARMTKFRKEFEDTMLPELGNFATIISARIARSDSAGLQSQTALGAALTPFGVPAGSPAGTAAFSPTITSQTQLDSLLTGTSSTLPTLPSPATAAPATFALLNQGTTATTNGTPALTGKAFGLEPNINSDEKADYITHLQRLRRINLGDDNSDSAGYGLYLMRVPVSIQPGDRTVKGHGAIVNLTMQHDFGPRFLPATYRNLVNNDVIDLLAPVIQELIRSGDAAKYHSAVQDYLEYKYKKTPRASTLDVNQSRVKTEDAFTKYTQIEKELQVKGTFVPVSRTGFRSYAIAPSDVKAIFGAKNLLNLAWATQAAIDMANAKFPDTWRVRGTDVRSFLRQEIESAYDLMEGRAKEPTPLLMDVPFIEDLTDQVYNRKFEDAKAANPDASDGFSEFYNLYEAFTHRLPGNTRYGPIGVLSWGIALEAGLLNRQLREDIKQTKAEDYTIPPNIDDLIFYSPTSLPDADAAFQAYIKARWPMLTFSLDPVVDQQNIEDSFTRRRDLQLAISFALSAGRISFRQAIQYTRQLQYESETIALNQTVAAFSHGNDTFGWRFSPRYQTPPEESNGRAITNLLLRGGPGPKYQINTSKIEPGMRELTAVVVMPSFIRGMRLDVANDWYRLSDPDEFKIHTARTVELGRRINEARDALDVACKCGQYRPEDTNRLRAKLHQLESMLPMQTQFVKVPYENTLGGFALFTQGITALVPELSGHEGVQYYDPTKSNDILVYGKHFSIYEMAVVVGGAAVNREGSAPFVSVDATGKPVIVNNSLTTLRDANGNLLVLTPTGTAIPVKDTGSYDILSREVLRVHLPTGMNTAKRDDGEEVIEIYVSTPNGISNRLQIPVKGQGGSFAPVGTPSGYTLIDSKLTIPIDATLNKDGTLAPTTAHSFATSTVVRIKAIDPTLPMAPTISVQVAVPINNNTAILPSITIPDVPLQGDTYVINASQLNTFATALYKSLDANGLASKLTTTTMYPTRPVLVQPNLPGAPLPSSSTTSGGMTIGFDLIVTGSTPDAAAKAAAPAAAASPTKNAANQANPVEMADPATRRAALTVSRPSAIQTATTSDPIAERLAAVEASAALAQNRLNAAVPPAINLPTLPQPVSQPLTVVSSRAPTVNVTVPITNVPPAMKPKYGLLHRKPTTGPAANVPTTRGPLLERLMGRP